ncbi:Gp37-like protein [Nocardia puris]|uniref:Gp28/Gp37-like domain-containing protein n=1 Tax=Nocardia puris TaxID=208602 RepID=A0A366DEL7_9NOCA|nr:hypothetical protein [Nocardia puris]RBO87959.1 hypothetical protein DFR74_110215 [Nocardia puris]
MTVVTIDFDATYARLAHAASLEKSARLNPPVVRFWDGDWNLRGAVNRIVSADIRELNNETGTALFELPLDYWMSDWVIDVNGRSTDGIHATVDRDGVRWSGRMESFTVVKNDDGTGSLRILFKHDYEELKHLLGYANPFACRPGHNRPGRQAKGLITPSGGAISEGVDNFRSIPMDLQIDRVFRDPARHGGMVATTCRPS